MTSTPEHKTDASPNTAPDATSNTNPDVSPDDSPFDPTQWRTVAGFEDLTDITYHRHVGNTRRDGIVRIAFDRPEVRNAFRPHTVDELYRALDHARRTPDVGTVLLTGNGPSPKDGGWAFCSGGDQRIRGRSGYRYATSHDSDVTRADESGGDTARCRRWSSRWSMVGPLVVGTRCMWCAT